MTISELSVGTELLNELFLLQEVALRTTKDGRPYILCVLRDKSGQAGAVFWNVPAYIEEWAHVGSAVLVTGRVVNYKESLQINITDMNPAHDQNLSELLPASLRPREEMLLELRATINSLNNPWQELTAHILLEESFLQEYTSAPAARSMHHGYIGGLLEHSLSMAAIAAQLADHYPHINKDLLIAGALLHDMGKTAEYSIANSFAITDDGRLVGHIVRAIIYIEKAAADLNFPEEELRQLVHLVASHHGTLEWGSPATPKTLEAVLLHHIDLLDSRAQGFLDHVRNDSNVDNWTSQSSAMFQTPLRRPPTMTK